MTQSYCLKLLLPIYLLLALIGPAAAIQNIGFPDDQSLKVSKSDLAQFDAARGQIHLGLTVLLKYDGVEGDAKKSLDALKTISANAAIIQDIVERADNSDIANFMMTIKSWSTSGDADDRGPELVKKIDASLRGLKATVK